MNSRRKILAVLLLVVMAVSLLSVCALAADDGGDVAKSITCTTCNGTGISQGEECGVCEGTGVITSTSRMAFSFWALVPPIVAIILALITKEVYSSLFVGILLGALFYSNFNPITGLDAIINDGMVPAVADNAGIMLFLVILGAMVALINRAGGSAAFGRWAETHIKTRVGAMFATFLLGVLIFVDDYFNCLTVGAVMRPRHREPQDFPCQAGLPHRRHGGPGVHDRPSVLVGGGGIRLCAVRRRQRHRDVHQADPVELLLSADVGDDRGAVSDEHRLRLHADP